VMFAIFGDTRRFTSDFSYAAVALCIIRKEESLTTRRSRWSYLWYG
jgi:hypothetical protein